jgi:carbon-monoxide dehydrogenase medium subunit
MPGVVLALKGEIVVQGPNNRRTIKADDFFIDTFTTALKPDEVLIELRFTTPTARTRSAYEKLANRASHYAIAGCAAMITLESNGTCTSASIAITGAAMSTSRASSVEATLVGKHLDQASVAQAARHASEGLKLLSDIHGSQEYRRQMSTVVTQRAILRAIGYR